MAHWEEMGREFKAGRMSGVNVEGVADVSSSLGKHVAIVSTSELISIGTFER